MADFNFYINRQGIQGRKGEKGDKGFSPTINVSTDTVDEYKLIIANEDNTFETPNLRGNINVLDNGGTYLRYDKETQQISAQDMDTATASTLGGVRLSTEENITAMSADTVVTPADVADALPVYLQGEGAVSITQDEATSKTKINVDLSSVNELTTRVSNAEAEIVGIQADVAVLDTDVSALKDVTTSHTTSISAINDNIANLNTNKVAKTDFATTETAGVVKVDGTTIITDENGVISSINTGTGDVTAAGNNRFTGDNTFIGKVNIAGGALTVDGVANLNQATAQFLNAASITSQGEINATSIKANGLRSDDIQTTENKKYLTELDVDNQTIQVINGKLHCNLDELDNEVNDLTSRVTVNEADISTLKTSKQDTLVSGTNIKTINGQSILGEGDMTVGGSTPTNMVTTDTKQTINASKRFYEGLTLGNPNGFRGLLSAGALSLGDGGPANLYLKADSKAPRINFYGDLVIGARISGSSITLNSWGSNLKVAQDTLNFTKQDGTVVDLLNQSGGGGTGDVTSDGDNTFTGNNTFSKTILATGSDALLVDNRTNSWTSPQGVEFTKGNDGISHEINYNFTVADGSGNEYQAPVENVTLAASGDLILKANNNNISSDALLTSTPTIKDGDGNIILSQGNITAGDNVTIDKTARGIKINSTASGGVPTNMVTTDTVQTITGQKSFTNSTNFGASGHAGDIKVGDLSDAYFRIYGSRSGANRYLGIGAMGSAASLDGSWFTQNELYYSKGTTGTIFGGIPRGSIRYLHEGLIEAGNGIVIESSTKLNGAGAIKISSTGATIDDVTSSTTSTYSSNKIDSLVGNISTVLDSINGEVI